MIIKAGIIGATGYAGNELARLLLQHPQAEVIWYGSRNSNQQKYASIYPNLFQLTDADCLDDNLEELAKKADVIFTATPQGYLASVLTEEILRQAKVIDLSADFRIRDFHIYEEWYGIGHQAKEFLPEAVYGLCELNRQQIRKARLIANPGCYPTCTILSVYPLLKEGLIEPGSIIIDAKSGTSGAGRSAKTGNLFCEVNENIKAYGVTTHRHTPEIEQELSRIAGEPLLVNFTPHLVPMNRGILITAYAALKAGVTEEAVRAAYENCYKEEIFVRVLPEGMAPETRFVEGSNYVDVNARVDRRTGRVVMMGAMDNLVKGAAGQAVQNMNLLFGLPENTGLKQVPMVP